jgi:hypothetical protein
VLDVREYLAIIEARLLDVDRAERERLAAWIRWPRARADAIDPLVRFPSIGLNAELAPQPGSNDRS